MLFLVVTVSWVLLSCVAGAAFGALFRGARAGQAPAVVPPPALVPFGLRPRASAESHIAYVDADGSSLRP